MGKHLDFTIDFETCSLSANAAVMQAAVVPWLRDNDTDPFINEPYVAYVDLRTCVVDGFDFDPDTVRWWAARSDAAKKAVTAGVPQPVTDIAPGIIRYILGFTREYGLESICLWAQGPDVDLGILRNLCRRSGIDLEADIPHAAFRDCRTVILEAALIEAERSVKGTGTRANGIALPQQVLAEPTKAYDLYPPLPGNYAEGREAHDALYDALRSSWNTWHALRWLRRN